MNSDIQKALEYTRPIYEKKMDLLCEDEVIKFWDGKDISWENLCTFSRMKIRGYYAVCKITLGMLIYLVEKGVYTGKYADKLQSDLPYLKDMYGSFKSVFADIFTLEYNEIVLLKINGVPGISLRKIADCNPVFKETFIQFIRQTREIHHQSNSTTDYHFPLSIGEQVINSYTDINSETFWNQINYYRELYRDDETAKDRSIKTVCRFYRWLVTEHSDYDFFSGSSNMTTELVLNNALVININRGAYFTTLTKTEDLGDKPIICFIIRNMDKYSTRFKKVDHFVLDTSNINTSLYRSLINKYIQNASSVTEATWSGFVSYTTNALHFIEEMKKQSGYPNPNIFRLNTAEAVLIRNFFEKDRGHIALPTLNNRIGAARRFFLWCKNTGKLTFDDTFFDYLSQYEEPNMYHGNAIPDEDLQKISDAFKEICKEDPAYLLYYAIFLIQLETEFRVSQICALKVSALQPTMKEDQFLIYSNTKTTNGRKTAQPICLSTKKILESVIEITQELRDASVSAGFAENIFLKKGVNGAVTPISSSMFLDTFKEICSIAGVKKYTSCNLRDTHMTKAFEFILKSGKSDLEMGLLSRHSHIDTTKNHYIEMELTKMLESTYEVVLDSRDINQREHVLSELPANLQGNDSAVEGGCGHCSASMCAIQGSTPCLICSHFVTTAAHKQYFIKMIEMVDRRLKNAVIPHEIEDLNLMKKLYVNWLREICIHEEEENAEHCDS